MDGLNRWKGMCGRQLLERLRSSVFKVVVQSSGDLDDSGETYDD